MHVRSEKGFSALELLVIIVIVCALVAIGVPTLHSRAKASVLDANLQSLASIVNEDLVEGYSSEYRSSGDGDAGAYLSLQLEKSMASAGKSAYVNPFGAPNSRRDVINSHVIPTDSRRMPPAIVITDAAELQYLRANALSIAARRLLVGTLVVAFDSAGRWVDVFYIDADGNKSSNVVSIPTA